MVPQPMLIRRVEDRDGRVLYAAQESSTRAISDTTAFLMSTMLADVINAGTGAGRAQLGFTLPAAGKTGTTNDFNDAWFVGFTPKLVTGVWVGFDQPRTILPNGFAGDVAVPLWANVHEGGDRRTTSRNGSRAPAGVTTATRLPPVRQARDRRLRGRRGRRRGRQARAPVDGLHRVLRSRHRADGVLRPAPDARHPRASSPASSRGDEKPAAAADRGHRPAAGGRRRPAAPSRAPATEHVETPAAGAAEEEARLLVADLRPGRRRRAQGDQGRRHRPRRSRGSRS